MIWLDNFRRYFDKLNSYPIKLGSLFDERSLRNVMYHTRLCTLRGTTCAKAGFVALWMRQQDFFHLYICDITKP